MQPRGWLLIFSGNNLALPCFVGLHWRYIAGVMVRILGMHSIAEVAVLSSLLKRRVQEVMAQQTIPASRKPKVRCQS